MNRPPPFALNVQMRAQLEAPPNQKIRKAMSNGKRVLSEETRQTQNRHTDPFQSAERETGGDEHVEIPFRCPMMQIVAKAG